MARRKNAAALFEVIHSDNRFPRRQGGGWSLRAPRWLRRREKSSEPAPVAPATIDYEPAAPRGPSLLSRLAALIPPMPRIGLALDAERQLVRFQLSYTGALVAAFGMVVAIGVAYMAGRQTSHRPMPALSEQTTEELRKGPAYADVLDLHGAENDPPVAMAVGAVPTPTRAPAAPQASSADAPPATGVTHSATASADAQRTQAQQAMRPSQWTEPKRPATYIVSDVNRTVGLQYVIIQSYPEEEKQLAESAVKTLNDHGVLCTMERGLPYAPSWYCVVGIMGFARTRDVPEYDAYVSRILQISNQFAGTSKFKKFEPKPFRWRETKSSPAKN